MSNQLQDEFDMGRIPIRPLSYEFKNKAFTQELMIDIQRSNDLEKPTMHLYITDPVDRTKIYDLSSLIVQEAFSGKDIMISIDGVNKPLSLHDILSYIYLRFIRMDNPSGFDPKNEIDKITDPLSKIVLLKDINDVTTFPVTRADSVYDVNGISLQDRLDKITRLGFSSDYLLVSYSGQNIFNIVYPFANYLKDGNFMQLMIGTTIIDKTRYRIEEIINEEDGKAYGCNIIFYNDTFEENRRIDILYIYNTTNIDTSVENVIDGHIIANLSISSNKLERISDSYTLNDSSCIASSKSVYNLYNIITDILANENTKSVFCKDLNPTNTNNIAINLANDNIVLSNHNILVNVIIEGVKNENLIIDVTSLDNYINRNNITKKFKVMLDNKLSKGKLFKFLLNEDQATVLNVHDTKLNYNRYLYISSGDEFTISFEDKLDYQDQGILEVYLNGLRLFKDIDYTLDNITHSIKLFSRTKINDKIVFENKYLSN